MTGTAIVLAIGLVVLIVVTRGDDVDRAPPEAPQRAAALPDGAGREVTSVRVTDATGTISFEVPDSWTDIDDGASSEQPSLAVSPDLEDALSGYGTPGIVVTLPDTDEPPDVVLGRLVDEGCAAVGSGSYEGAQLSGVFLEQVGCGGTDATLWTVVVASPEGRTTGVITMLAPTPTDAAAAARALDTLVITGG